MGQDGKWFFHIPQIQRETRGTTNNRLDEGRIANWAQENNWRGPFFNLEQTSYMPLLSRSVYLLEEYYLCLSNIFITNIDEKFRSTNLRPVLLYIPEKLCGNYWNDVGLWGRIFRQNTDWRVREKYKRLKNDRLSFNSDPVLVELRRQQHGITLKYATWSWKRSSFVRSSFQNCLRKKRKTFASKFLQVTWNWALLMIMSIIRFDQGMNREFTVMISEQNSSLHSGSMSKSEQYQINVDC